MFKPANAAAIYSGIGTTGAAISNKLTASAGIATIDLPPLGSVGSFPVSLAGDYYVYAILDPVPSDANCRPYAEIKVTIKDSIIPVITSGVVASNASTFTWNDIPTANKFGVDTTRLASTLAPTSWKSAGTVANTTGGSGNTFTFNGIPLGQTAHIKITPQDISGTKLACSNSAMSSITNPNCTKPIPLALTAPIAVCEGASLSILGSLDPNSVPASFKWRISSDGANWSDVSGPDFDVTTLSNTLSIPKTKFSMNNNFVKLVVTDNATGACKDSTLPVRILVNELPNASLSINPDPALLCIGASQLISVTFLGNKGIAPYIFDYTLDGVIQKDSSLVGSSVLTYDFTTDNVINDSTFILTNVTDKNGCSKSISINNSVTMQVIPVPTPVFTADQTIGCYPFKVIFTDKSTTLNKEVEWDFGDGSPVSKDLGYTSYIFKKAGDFTITFKSTINGCSDTMMKTEYIHVKERPIAQFSPKITNISMIDPEIQFVNSSSSNTVYYKWIFGDGSPVSNLTNPKHTFIGQGNSGLPDPGKYVVELYAYVNQDCWDSTSTTITIDDEQIYYIPNTFTPNGDEKNNTFQPIFTSGYDAQNYHFLIYNRWGELVFESNNPAIGWDGTYGNKLLSNETYSWKLQFKEKMTEKEHYLTGHVNLIR
jgi:gliding motility-associated-like protein